ncbi:MAG: bacillithiol system redox-active protein YtxJ [Saprospiraceae bacterium]|nr:bacillithiol system redox-active protein YtxJ [Bacteroidia bacterium]NNK90754.1 bacillithiol system redox-active protein YtxJ [Saprospiraceae bacterium]
MVWYELESLVDLDELVETSSGIPSIIFKHSTRCGISKFVLKNFERGIGEFDPSEARFYFLDLIKHRDISNQIEKRFSIIHESPQVIMIHKGETIFDASHQGIQAHQITERLKTI